ncbi:MAG: hypothetical protein ACLFU4_06545 [Opitutales bacterium]
MFQSTGFDAIAAYQRKRALPWHRWCAAAAGKILLLLALLLPLSSTSQAEHFAPPPGIRLEGPEAPVVIESKTADPAPADATPQSTSEVPVARTYGDGVSAWLENAENGSGNVIDGTDPAYSLIQSEVAAEGSHAFHLAHPSAPNDDYFELDINIDVLADTKLFFQSRLGTATTDQIAKVQVSADGGSSWPHTVYEQAGSGQPGEGSFAQRQIDLGDSFSGQQVRIRFYYDFTGGSYFQQTTTHVGWLIDNIQIGSELQKAEWTIGEPTASEVLYLEYINRARADALVEADRLANTSDSDSLNAYSAFGINPADIIIQFDWYVNNCMDQSAQPLAFQEQLMLAAQLHTLDMFENEFQGHDSSSNPPVPFQPGDSLGDRLAAVGYALGPGGGGENVYAYAKSVEHGHAGFDVDWGGTTNTASPCYNPDFDGQGMQNPSGHRISIHNGIYNEVGIGVINGSNGSVGPQLVTQDFGGTSATYITGVVYLDEDNNNFYSAPSDSEHEGVGGVRVDVDGSGFYTLSTASGAYAIPVDGDGSYSVTFSGAGITTYSTEVMVSGGLNVKLDHKPVMITSYNAWSASNELAEGPEGDDDGDGVSNIVEWLLLGMDPTAADAHTMPEFAKSQDGNWRLSLELRPEAGDVSKQVLFSDDLIDWEQAGVFPGTQVEVDTADEFTVSADGTHDKLFVRLSATLEE